MPKEKKVKNVNILSRRKSFSFLQITLFALIFGAMGVFAVLQSSAAPGGGKGGGKPNQGTGSLSLVMEKDVNGDGLPNHGDFIKFNVATTATDKPWVNLKCYSGSTLIAEGWETYFDGGLGNGIFGLYSGPWTSGAAECTAYLKLFDGKGNDDYSTITSISFRVNP